AFRLFRQPPDFPATPFPALPVALQLLDFATVSAGRRTIAKAQHPCKDFSEVIVGTMFSY
ncbi:hypothetical protein ACFDR9_005141, partial [Janthinobacterium sp. CG_23.3]|uniref:hypothetical protein n=1 Tax=Janthinobacterium sp. CG_23.3 TaxID=3349634 RepID=UPI0038D36B21